MKGYDTINRYCGRLESRLDDISDKEEIVEEIKQHLQDRTESLINEGCLPEAAELLAIEEMGSDIVLASQLKKYAEKLPREQEGFLETVKDFRLKTIIEYTGYSRIFRNVDAIRWGILLYPILIVLYIAVIWNLLSYRAVDLQSGKEAVLKAAGVVSIMSVTVFSLLLSSLDRYKPYFCKKNILWLAGALAAALIAYPLVKVVFLYGGYYIISIYSYFAEVRAAKIFYFIQKFLLAIIACCVLHFGLKEKKKYTVLTALTAIVPLAVFFMPLAVLDVYWVALLLACAALSVYITVYCRKKYTVRILMQFFCLMGLAETAAVYLINIK
ncbi:MAG: hypothetical protein IKS17_06020 [Firmicutes bacterium]|nr:hypothetical protein [Bacillota bacterium]